MQKLIAHFNDYVLNYAFILFVFSEFLSKVNLEYTGDYLIITKIIKSFFFLFFVVKLLSKKKFIVAPIILSISFLIGQLTLDYPLSTSILYTFIKHLFLLCLLYYFLYIPRTTEVVLKLQKSLEYIFLINSLLVILGFLLNISLFETYNGSRFGYSGFFINSTTASYAYVCTFLYFINRYKEKLFKNYIFLIIFLSASLIGTKVIYLTQILLPIYFFYCFKKRKYFYYISSLLLVIGGGALYYSLFVSSIFNSIRLKYNILSSLSSLRYNLLIEDTIPYIKQNWSFVNWIFGGIHDYSLRSEFGGIDIVFLFGFLGSIIFLLLIIGVVKRFEPKRELAISLGYVFFIYLIAGNLFNYATTHIYIILILSTFRKQAGLKSYYKLNLYKSLKIK